LTANNFDDFEKDNYFVHFSSRAQKYFDKYRKIIIEDSKELKFTYVNSKLLLSLN
jgi:hypothetical protein